MNKLPKIKATIIPLFLSLLITTSAYAQSQPNNGQQAQTQTTPNDLSKYTVPVQILPPRTAKSITDEGTTTESTTPITPPQAAWQSDQMQPQPTQPTTAPTPPPAYVPLYKKDVWEKLRVPPRDKPRPPEATTEQQTTNEQMQSSPPPQRVNIYK